MKYAKGRKAWGMCQKSGLRTLHRKLVRDGDNPGLMVLPDWRDEKHPQEKLRPRPDRQALKRPAPDLDAFNASLSPWTNELGFMITDENLNIIQFT